MPELRPGDVVWVAPDATVGREQSGRRPALVVSGEQHLATATTLAMVVPLTGVDRGWPNHIELRGGDLAMQSWAMTEQLRTISRERIGGRAGRAEATTLAAVRVWLADFLEL